MAIIYRQNRRSRKLTMDDREDLPLSDFVFPDRAPGVGSYPINDLYHAKLALNMASWSEKGKREMPYILDAVLRKYPQLDNWKHIDRYYDIADQYSTRQLVANPPLDYPMRDNLSWSDLAFWRKEGFKEGSARAWDTTKRTGASLGRGLKRGRDAVAYQAKVVQLKSKVSGAQGRIRSLKNCADELDVSDSALEQTKAMQSARTALARAKKNLKEFTKKSSTAPVEQQVIVVGEDPVAANPRRRNPRRNRGIPKFEALKQEYRDQYGPKWFEDPEVHAEYKERRRTWGK